MTSLPELEVKYQSESIEQLTLTKVSLWNSGRDTVDSKDISKIDYLKISAPDNVIFYSSKINFVNREINELKIFNSENEIKISFDFLDYIDGGVIDVYHNGSEDVELTVSGTVKGGLPIGYGKKEEFFITKAIGNFLLPTYFSAEYDGLSKFDKIFFWILFPVGIIVMFAFTPIDIILKKVMKNIPSEYEVV